MPRLPGMGVGRGPGCALWFAPSAPAPVLAGGAEKAAADMEMELLGKVGRGR